MSGKISPLIWTLFFLMCLFALIISAISYSYAIFLLLLPVLVILLVICLIRFHPRSTQPNIAHLLAATGLLVIWGYLFQVGDSLGDDVRWSIWSASYKRNVISTPASPADVSDPNPRHMFWRGWGGMGMDNEADLVFDNSGVLARAVADISHNEKTVYGCPVARISQLERNWYIVTLFTNEGWPGC